MYQQKRIDLRDNSVTLAYASHVIEHAFDIDVQFFFNDVYRVLTNGGIFRITAPNIDLGIRALQTSDYFYYGKNHYNKMLIGLQKRLDLR